MASAQTVERYDTSFTESNPLIYNDFQYSFYTDTNCTVFGLSSNGDDFSWGNPADNYFGNSAGVLGDLGGNNDGRCMTIVPASATNTFTFYGINISFYNDLASSASDYLPVTFTGYDVNGNIVQTATYNLLLWGMQIGMRV